MKRKSFQGLASALSLGALAVIVLSGPGHAATLTKADNTSALDLGVSWGGTAPGAADTARWAGTYNTAGSLAAALPGAALSWDGIAVGSLSGTSAGLVSIGGTAAAPAGSALNLGSGGILLTGANQNVVLNAETTVLNTSQTWLVPNGRNLRLGSLAMTANVDGTGGSATVITVTGGGVVDANQGALSGFGDFTGKWIVDTGTTLRGVQDGTKAWGSNPDADAMLLKGGTLAVGGMTGATGNWVWGIPITLQAGTTSIVSGQNPDTSTRTLALQGAISGDGNLSFEKTSGGTLRISVDKEDNPFTGAVTITGIGAGVTASNLTVQGSVGTAGGTKTPLGFGTITVINGGTLEFKSPVATAAAVTVANPINLNNANLTARDALQTYTGTISLTGANTIQGAVDLKHTTLDGLIQDGASAGSLTIKSISAQQMILPNANTYTGGSILGNNTSNAGIVVLGDPGALGSGTVTLRGAQLWADAPGFILANPVMIGQTGAGGGLCLGGQNDISFSSTVTLDNASRPFLNSSAALGTLAGINLSAGTTATASFGSNTIKGAFLVTGSITGAGKVEVKGGTVTLAGANTYTGSTAISSVGRLNLTGTLTSNITMTGSLASISGAGTTTGNLTASGANGGTIWLDPTTPTEALTANTVTISGPTKVDLLALQAPGTSSYTVLNYTTLAAGSIANLTTTAARGVVADDPINKRITLSVTTGDRTWNRATSGNWNLTDENWVEGDKKYANGDVVTFGNTGAGTVALVGTLTPYSVAFDNAVGNDYILTSSTGNQLSGVASMTKAGGGKVSLIGENRHTGMTTLSGGVMAITADHSLGTVPATPVADQLRMDGGTLTFELAAPAAAGLHANRGITLNAGGGTFDTTAVGSTFTGTIGGAIAGNGPLTLRANGDTTDTGGAVPGAMMLTGANTFTGPIRITSGVVSMAGVFGDDTNTVILDGGGIVDQNLNLTFNHPLQIGAAGGVLRSYQTAITTFTGSLANAEGVLNAEVRHTDGGTQFHSGDASGFNGSFINSRGTTYFESPNWQGTSIVNVDGDVVRFRSGTVTHVSSIITDRDVFIEPETILDVATGNITVAPGTAIQNFWIQGGGTLTSSSGTLTLNWQTNFMEVGAEDQAVSVLVADYNAGTPVTVVKNGPGSVNTFNQSNTYTGGTLVNAGRINVSNDLALGTGLATVKSGGQLYLSLAGGIYVNDATIEGTGPSEAAGNLGAIRFNNNTLSGNLTIAPAGARMVAYMGATGTIEGTLNGGGALELNSSTASHNGVFNITADGTAYTGVISVAQGGLNLTGTVGGEISLANGTTLSGEGTATGKVTLGGGTGINLRVNGLSAEALTVGKPTLNGPSRVQLDSLPDPLAPITVLNYTTLTGSVTDFQNAPTSIRRLVFTDTGTSIVGEVTIASRTWAGTVSSAWDSTALNWAEGDQRFFTGDSVVFDDTATNKVVNIANPVSPATVEFSNSAGNDYTITGTINTLPGGKVIKSSTGNVTLTGAPSNLGGDLEINGGRVTLATTDYAISLGATAGIVVNDTGILRLNGINVLYNATNNTLVTVNGGGIVELNAYHTHFRDLILNGGTLVGMRSDADTRYNNEYATFDTSVKVGGSQMSTISRIAGGTGTYNLAGAPFDVADAATGTDLLVNAPLVGGMLTKNGVGTMTMAVSSSYGGGTVINAGSLVANNPNGSGTGNGPVTVKTGALLGGTGTVGGAVTVESGGTLAPGEPIESLSTGALTLAEGSTLAMDFSSAGTPTTDSVNVGGNVSLAGTLSLADLAATQQIVAGGTKLTLLSYTGTLAGTFVGLAEEATLTVGVNTFKIRYDDGKKVTLESLASVDDYATWASAYAPLGLPTADNDSDGLTNREEYIFGLHPKSSTSVNVITSPLSKATGMFTYVRRKPSLTGLSFKVWTSSNLSVWTEDTAALQTPTDVGDNQTVSVTLSGAKPLTAPKLFVRITAQ